MSRTLPLVDSLLGLARKLQKAGRHKDAADLLTRLTGFRSLSPEVAEEVHERLATLHGVLENFKKARRHLTAALTYRPGHAEYYHRMATLIEADPDAALHRAEAYHRQAVRLEPSSAEHWTDLGVYLLTFGKPRAGIKALCRAFRLGSHDPAVVGEIASALRDAGCRQRATKLLRVALFQSGGDRRFQQLWQRHQFDLLHADQQAEAGAPTPAERGKVLPFAPAETTPRRTTVDGKILRFDPAATDRGEPNLPLPKRARGTR